TGATAATSSSPRSRSRRSAPFLPARSPPASSVAASSSPCEGHTVLILVRHGESVANAQGLLLGRTDAALTAHGRRQVAAARLLLADPVAEVRTSPLVRARDTADLLGLGVPASVDERWIEIDYGAFECQPLGSVPAEVWERWYTDRDFRPEGGETLAEVDA